MFEVFKKNGDFLAQITASNPYEQTREKGGLQIHGGNSVIHMSLYNPSCVAHFFSPLQIKS